MGTLAEREDTVETPGVAFRPLVSVTLAVLAVVGGQPVCLLNREAGGWCLPGHVPGADESLDDAAQGELLRHVPRNPTFMEQLYTRGDSQAGGSERRLEVAYLALTTGPANLEERAGTESPWWPLDGLPPLPAGHREFLEQARRRCSRLLTDTNAAWSLLPLEFTLSDVQSVYEAIQNRTLDKRNFRKWILAGGMLEATPHERRYGPHRPARLYRFASRELRTIE